MTSYLDIEDKIAEDMGWRGASYGELKKYYSSYTKDQLDALESGDRNKIFSAFGIENGGDWEYGQIIAPYEYYRAVQKAMTSNGQMYGSEE